MSGETRKYNRLKQHEQLRVPRNWKDEEKAFIIQLDRILDDIYTLLGKLDQRIKALEEDEE